MYWPDDDEYYNAKISSKKTRNDGSNHVYTLVYDDGEVETIDLSKETFRIVHQGVSTSTATTTTTTTTTATTSVDDRRSSGGSIISQEEEEEEEGSEDDAPVTNPTRKKKQSGIKRKVIQESDYDDEEEAEFDDEMEDEEEDDDDGQSDVSEFIVDTEDEGKNDDDEDISMAMTEDEQENEDGMEVDDDEDVPKKTKSSAKKRLRVTQISRSNHDGKSSFITPPPKKKKTSLSNTATETSLSSKLNSFAAFASSGKQSKSNTNDVNSQTKTIREITPPQQLDFKSPPRPTTSTTKTNKVKTPKPIPQVVNQAGTHWHNHFTFLQPHKRRDAKNRPMSHPDYDPRTLKVDYNEMSRVTNSKLTPASQQWWELKARYADTFLLFKTGKFYEIFHEDADVSVNVLGFNYMKGTVAHTGFPEIGYGGFCEKLIKAGCKVARVEQTETPEMLKERKKKIVKGKKPSVVNREVCSIVSAGTRTFCYMDDVSGLEKGHHANGGNSGIGPLLAIREIIVPTSSVEFDEVQPVCEYGITLVDATTGEITLGQFADDVLRSRMNTLLTKFSPSEILIEGGEDSASETLLSLINGAKNSILTRCQVEKINAVETFPKSTAIDSTIRSKMERPTTEVRPWDNDETLQELHRRGYYPRSSRKKNNGNTSSSGSISRWPEILKVCVEGGAALAISSFGAALFYLQRNLIDEEILSMGIIKGYIPPEPVVQQRQEDNRATSSEGGLRHLISQEERQQDGMEETTTPKDTVVDSNESSSPVKFSAIQYDTSSESSIDHLSLDGTTIANLEILANSHSNTSAGSLWSKINFTKSPSGNRLLRAWLLRPLFRKEDIDRRANAVEELTTGGAAAAMTEARAVLSKCGDMERLLSRVHSMGYSGGDEEGNGHHPNERAVLYENPRYTKRKVGDFSKLIDGLQAAARIPEMFEGVDIRSPLLGRIVRTQDKGGLFPSNIEEELDWFTSNFDCRKAAQGLYEPSRGVNGDYDAACDEIVRIKKALEDYRMEMCEEALIPKHTAKSQWKYVNTKEDQKDKYLIELPISVNVPNDFIVKGKR